MLALASELRLVERLCSSVAAPPALALLCKCVQVCALGPDCAQLELCADVFELDAWQLLREAGEHPLQTEQLLLRCEGPVLQQLALASRARASPEALRALLVLSSCPRGARLLSEGEGEAVLLALVEGARCSKRTKAEELACLLLVLEQCVRVCCASQAGRASLKEAGALGAVVDLLNAKKAEGFGEAIKACLAVRAS